MARVAVAVCVGLGALALEQAYGGAFNIQSMSGDATSGISAAKTYTHAIDLNRTGSDPLGGNDALPLTINGVPFTGITDPTGGVDANFGGVFATTGTNATFNGHNPGVSGGVGDLLDDFFHNGNGAGGATPGTETLTLSGLTPGQAYTTVSYVGGFGSSLQNITVSDTGVTIYNVPRDGGLSPGARIEYTYVAPASGSVTYTFDAQSNNDSFHQYGFTNEESPLVEIPGLFSTGVDDTGTPLGDSVADPHYEMIGQPGAGLVATTIPADGFPIPPWFANTSTSRWIAPDANDGTGPGGPFVYRTTFDLAGFDLDTAFLSGMWASDDAAGSDILINGVSTGQSNNGFGTLTPFLINDGFLQGANTLDFVFNNGSTGPTGLRVEGLAGFARIPEPSSILLLGLGAFGLLGLWRRRNSA